MQKCYKPTSYAQYKGKCADFETFKPILHGAIQKRITQTEWLEKKADEK